jgi:hypothetical protein
MTASELVRIPEDAQAGVRVGRCDGDGRFVAVPAAPGARPAIVFVFDGGGHFLQALTGPDGPTVATPGEALDEVLAALEPYAFEEAVDVRPFRCHAGGQSAGLIADADARGYTLRPPGTHYGRAT